MSHIIKTGRATAFEGVPKQVASRQSLHCSQQCSDPFQYFFVLIQLYLSGYSKQWQALFLFDALIVLHHSLSQIILHIFSATLLLSVSVWCFFVQWVADSFLD